VLTVRNDAEEWYRSMTAAQTRDVKKGRLPTADDLRERRFHEPGWSWKQHQLVYGVDDDTLYDRTIYLAHYDAHNCRIRHYFSGRPDDLLDVNLADETAMERLCAFLGVEFGGQAMPHLNRAPDPSSMGGQPALS
jgi:hypothetical protein